jgi:hypothetical protein
MWEFKCTNCKKWNTDPDHPCYMQRKRLKPHSEKYIWLDFEANEKCPCRKDCLPGIPYEFGSYDRF